MIYIGMFLFAKLVMKNFFEQTCVANLREEMRPEVFPHGLDQAYEIYYWVGLEML